MNKKELNEYLNKQISTRQWGHAYLFYSSQIEEFNEEILQFLYKIIFFNIEKYRNEILEEDKKKNIISQIKNSVISDFNILDGNDANTQKVREFFLDIEKKPLILENKIYIIDNFDMLNDSAQNVTLKTLEEPPRYAIIVIKASNMNGILDTVRSRCQKIYLGEDNFDNNYKIDEKMNELASNIIKDTEISKYTIYYAKYCDKITRDNIVEILRYLEKNIFLDIINKYEMTEIVVKANQKINRNENFEMVKDYLLENIWGVKNGNS